MFRRRAKYSSRPPDSPTTYMGLLLSGDALQEDIDDYVDAWHDSDDDMAAAAEELPDFLGMTHREYELWAERPTALPFIACAHKTGHPVENVIQTFSNAGIAARAVDQNEARKLLKWLEDTGRLDRDR
jgi:hypothetical protein